MNPERNVGCSFRPRVLFHQASWSPIAPWWQEGRRNNGLAADEAPPERPFDSPWWPPGEHRMYSNRIGLGHNQRLPVLTEFAPREVAGRAGAGNLSRRRSIAFPQPNRTGDLVDDCEPVALIRE